MWEWVQPASTVALEYEHEADGELEDVENTSGSSGTVMVVGAVVAVIGFVYLVLVRGGSRSGKTD